MAVVLLRARRKNAKLIAQAQERVRSSTSEGSGAPVLVVYGEDASTSIYYEGGDASAPPPSQRAS
jgi:hypothetical protein